MVLQGIKNAFIASGVRFWSLCDLTHNNIRSERILALTFAFIMAGALSFLVLLLTPPNVPGLQLNVIALPGQSQTLGAPLRDFSIQLQRANGQAMADVNLRLELIPNLPFNVETRVLSQLVPNFPVDCRKDFFWQTRPYLCNMSSIEGAQTVRNVKTNVNGLAVVKGLKLNYGPPGEYELRITSINADPILPDIDSSITVSFFAAVERLKILDTDIDYNTGVIKAQIDVYANVKPDVLASSLSAVLPMRYPRLSGIVPGWLPVASILPTDEPIIDPTQQFFKVENARALNANQSIGRINVVTRLVGSTGSRFGASLFIGGESVPLTALVGDIFYPEVVSEPAPVVIPNINTISFSTTMPPPTTIVEATNSTFQIAVKDASGNGVSGVVVTLKAIRRFSNPNAALRRATRPKFLPFNHTPPTDVNGVTTFHSDYLFSLTGEVGAYTLYASIGYLSAEHQIAVLSRVGILNNISLTALNKATPVRVDADTIVKSKMNFFVHDELSLTQTGTLFPVPGKLATLSLEGRSDITIETSPRTLISDFQGYFYVDGLRFWVPPKKAPAAAYTIKTKLQALVDGRVVHSVPYIISVGALRNTTKSKIRTATVKSECIPFNLSISKSSCSDSSLTFCPYNYSVDFFATSTSIETRFINDLLAYSPLSDSGLLLEKRFIKRGNNSFHYGSYSLRVTTSLSTVPPYSIFNIFLMSKRCQPSQNALNPWISGKEMSFALFPDAREMLTVSHNENLTSQELTVVHSVKGAPLSRESDELFITYYPSWFPRENYDRSRISSLGLNASCTQFIDSETESSIVCSLPLAAFVYPGAYYFIPNAFGIMMTDAGVLFRVRQDLWNGIHDSGNNYDYFTKKIILKKPKLGEDKDGDPEEEGVSSYCAFDGATPILDVAFRPINKSTGEVLPVGTAFYFKLRRRQASDGQVFTYDMWSNASHMKDAALARLITKSQDVAAQNAPTEEEGTSEDEGFEGEDEDDYYGGEDLGASSFQDDSFGSGFDPNEILNDECPECLGDSDLSFSDSTLSGSSSSSALSSSSSSSSSSFGSSSSVSSSNSSSDEGDDEDDDDEGPDEIPYIAPPVAFVEDFGEDDGLGVFVYLVDLAGFRAQSDLDIIELVIFTADDVEIDTMPIQIGNPNNGEFACQYNVNLAPPAPANIATIPPSVVGPLIPWGFVWKTEADFWQFGVVATVKCVDAITREEVACQVDTAESKNSWYTRSFISKDGTLRVLGIVFTKSVPTSRTYIVQVYFPGFDVPFQAGQIYNGLDGCNGAVSSELAPTVEAATSYYTSAQFTCAKLPLKRTLVVATAKTGTGDSTSSSCAGDSCATLSSPRDFATTDNNGNARFQLLIASAPAGPITISYAPATPELYTKAAQLDAIFAVGVGKPINGNVPGALLADAYQAQSTSTVARLFSSLSTLISQENRPAVGKPAVVRPLDISFSYIRNLIPRQEITFEKVDNPMLFLDKAMIIQLNATSADFGLKQRVSIEVWDADGKKQVTKNWVTFNNRVRQWFMLDEQGIGTLPNDAFVWGTGGTFTLRFNCRGVLSAPSRKFTIKDPNAASIADLQEQAQSMMSLFLLVASPMLIANVPEMPHFVTFIALFMCVAAMGATPAVVDIPQMFKDTPLLGVHILVTYLIVYFLALGFFIMLLQGILGKKNPNSRVVDREERAVRAFRYYRWLANARKSKKKSDQDEFEEMLEEQTDAIGKKIVKPVRVIIDKLTSWNEALNYNLVQMLGEWEEVKVLDWEPAVIDPPEYLMPPTAPRYILVMSIATTLTVFMIYTGFTMLQFIDQWLQIFESYLSAVVGSSADVFNQTVLNTLRNSVGLVIERFPEFGFLRSLIPLIESINLGSILNTISILVESFAKHALLLGFISLAVAFLATCFSLSRTSVIREETLKQRRKLNGDGDLANAENYVGIHCVIFAFQALAAFVVTYVFLIGLVVFFRYLPEIWNWFWTSDATSSLGTVAIITTVMKYYMDFFAKTKIYVMSPMLYGLLIIPLTLHSIFAGIGVLLVRVFNHIFVGFAFAFAIVTRPLTDPIEDPVYIGFTSMAAIDSMYQNPAFLSALSLFIAFTEQKNFYISTKERAEIVKKIVATNEKKGMFPVNARPIGAPPLPEPKRLPNPSDFGQSTFYPHLGQLVRIWISFDMGLLDRMPWINEARRDPADDETKEDPMVDHESRQGLLTKISKFFFAPAENISMTPEEVVEEMKAQDKEQQKAASVPENEIVITRTFDSAMFPYDRPRWPCFAPEDIRRRRYQRKWYLLLLLHFNPDLQKYRKHRLVQMSGYHYAPDGSAVKQALEKVYGPEIEEGKEVVDIDNNKNKKTKSNKKEEPAMIVDRPAMNNNSNNWKAKDQLPLLGNNGGRPNDDELEQELMNFVGNSGASNNNNNNNNNSTGLAASPTISSPHQQPSNSLYNNNNNSQYMMNTVTTPVMNNNNNSNNNNGAMLYPPASSTMPPNAMAVPDPNYQPVTMPLSPQGSFNNNNNNINNNYSQHHYQAPAPASGDFDDDLL